VACNDVKRGQGVALIWAGGCISREGGLYKYEQVNTWSCSSVLEEIRQNLCALDGCGYTTSLVLWRVGGGGMIQWPLEQGVGIPRGLLGDETTSLMKGMYNEVFIRC
jgi:hypothetical protein